MRRSLPVANSLSRAPGIRYSVNVALSDLKPVVSMLAMLLATMSSSWLSDICRDKPTRSAFCIGKLPLRAAEDAVSPASLRRLSRGLSQACGRGRSAEAVPMRKSKRGQSLSGQGGVRAAGRNRRCPANPAKSSARMELRKYPLTIPDLAFRRRRTASFSAARRPRQLFCILPVGRAPLASSDDLKVSHPSGAVMATTKETQPEAENAEAEGEEAKRPPSVSCRSS